MTPSNPQIAMLGAEFDAATAHAQKLLGNGGVEHMMRRPHPQSWSPAECIAHLSVTTRAYLPLLDGAIADARSNGILANGPFRMDLMGRLLRWSLEPPVRFRFKTGSAFQPVAAAEPQGILPEFVSLQQQLIERLFACDGLALDKIKIVSPFNARVTYNLLSCFAVLAAHERRHLWQAEKALSS